MISQECIDNSEHRQNALSLVESLPDLNKAVLLYLVAFLQVRLYDCTYSVVHVCTFYIHVYMYITTCTMYIMDEVVIVYMCMCVSVWVKGHNQGTIPTCTCALIAGRTCGSKYTCTCAMCKLWTDEVSIL